MNKAEIDSLAVAWSYAKQAEAEAVAQRRAIEDKLTAALGIKETEEGVTNAESLNYTVKVTNRLTRKVDAELIQEIAAEHGLGHLLPTVCRWKPELDMRVWKGLDDNIRSAFSKAVTTTASRPSYSINAITKEN